jgi:hypothetical protein
MRSQTSFMAAIKFLSVELPLGEKQINLAPLIG